MSTKRENSLRIEKTSNDIIAGNGRERFMIEFKFIEIFFFEVLFNFKLIVCYDYTNKQIQMKDFFIKFKVMMTEI